MATLRETTAAMETVKGLRPGRAVYVARELQSRGMLPLGPQGPSQHAPHLSPEQMALYLIALSCPGPAPEAAAMAETMAGLQCDDSPWQNFLEALAYFITERGHGPDTFVEQIAFSFDASYPTATILVYGDGDCLNRHEFESWADYDRRPPTIARGAVVDGDIIARLARLHRVRAVGADL